MKKISLRWISEILSEKELKNVMAGSAGTCGYQVPYQGFLVYDCGVDKATAMAYVNTYGGNWCCDSCSTTSYCG